MISYSHESIFHSDHQTITNCVNTIGAMGRGIALDFKKRYPAMFLQYQKHCQNREIEIGKLWLYKAEPHWILGFPTKIHFRDKSKLEYIEAGLTKFTKTYQAKGIKSIAFPQLGCGLGGLSWADEVQPLIEKYLQNLHIPVTIHLYTSQN